MVSRRIYVTINRQIYEFFFLLEKEGLINNQKINFNCGKNKYTLNLFRVISIMIMMKITNNISI